MTIEEYHEEIILEEKPSEKQHDSTGKKDNFLWMLISGGIMIFVWFILKILGFTGLSIGYMVLSVLLIAFSLVFIALALICS